MVEMSLPQPRGLLLRRPLLQRNPPTVTTQIQQPQQNHHHQQPPNQHRQPPQKPQQPHLSQCPLQPPTMNQPHLETAYPSVRKKVSSVIYATASFTTSVNCCLMDISGVMTIIVLMISSSTW